MLDPMYPIDNPCGYVRECWLCGHPLTHEDDHVTKCPICKDRRLVPFGARFVLSDLLQTGLIGGDILGAWKIMPLHFCLLAALLKTKYSSRWLVSTPALWG